MLKKDLVQAMQRSFPGINPNLSEWKGQEITDFQEDLFLKAKGRISEKSFYTHFKSGRETLPRIDVLNLLSRYAGYLNWDDFRFRHADTPLPAVTSGRANRVFILVPLATIGLLLLFIGLYRISGARHYAFSFYDADTREPLRDPVELLLLSDRESPVSYLSGPDGSVVLKAVRGEVKLVVKSPYYLTDTITRILKKYNSRERIGLRQNDFAMMIRYFSEMKVDDWKRRREQLDRMFDDKAVICQVYRNKNGPGMALLNKEEFIDRLTMPSGSLRQIEVLDTRLFHEKIMILRFRVKPDKP